MKPMLAGTVGANTVIPFPVFASPKIDGIRAIVQDSSLLTRRLLPVPNYYIYSALSISSFNGLDGELVVGPINSPDTYRVTLSGVMTRAGAPLATFWVFDRWDNPGQFMYRRDFLPRKTLTLGGGLTIRTLKQEIINNADELLAYEQRMLAQGFEGVMLRRTDGKYKFGRSTPDEFLLMKLKRFQDSEAKIIGLVEQVHNANVATINELGYTKRSSHKANRIPKGTTGALQVRDLKTGVMFEIGTGMDDATRAAFWKKPPIGKICKYKFQPHGIKDKPRFPVFLGLRDRRDR